LTEELTFSTEKRFLPPNTKTEAKLSLFHKATWSFLLLTNNLRYLTLDIIKSTVRFCVYFRVTSTHVYYLSVTFKEGFFVDYIQKVTVDYLVKGLFIRSANFFNANFFNLNTIRFFLDEVYTKLGLVFSKNEDRSLGSLVKNIVNLLVLLLPAVVLILTSLTVYI